MTHGKLLLSCSVQDNAATAYYAMRHLACMAVAHLALSCSTKLIVLRLKHERQSRLLHTWNQLAALVQLLIADVVFVHDAASTSLRVLAWACVADGTTATMTRAQTPRFVTRLGSCEAKTGQIFHTCNLKGSVACCLFGARGTGLLAC